MIKRARCDSSVDITSVKLNVGGRCFEVSRRTIQAFGYLQARLQNSDVQCDNIFVDRDPVYFDILLQAVRTFTRPPQHLINKFGQQLLDECAFYCIDSWLFEVVRGKISDAHMRPEDRGIRTAEMKDEVTLIDPFEHPQFQRRHASELGTVLLETCGNRQLFNCDGAMELVARLNTMTDGLINKLRGIDGMIIAGGAPRMCKIDSI